MNSIVLRTETAAWQFGNLVFEDAEGAAAVPADAEPSAEWMSSRSGADYVFRTWTVRASTP